MTRAILVIAMLTVAVLAGCGGRAVPPPDPCSSGSIDADRDGHAALPCGDDCDDADAARHPGAPDALGDGEDTDCDGVDGVDADRDGFQSAAHGGDDCDDLRATAHPGANDNEGWSIESTGVSGHYASLAVDRAGCAYLATTGGNPCAHPDQYDCPPEAGDVVYHATNLDGAWAQTVVWDGDRVLPTVAIGVLRPGVAIISYPTLRDFEGEVWLATCEALDPSCSRVPLPAWGVVDGGTDIVVDAQGNPYVAHVSPMTIFARVNGAWSWQPVGSRGGHSPALAAGPDGPLVASWGGGLEDEPGTVVALVRIKDTSWTTDTEWSEEIVTHPEQVNYQDVAVAVDPNGEVRILYANDEGVFVADKQGGSWSATQLGDYAWAVDIAADSKGHFHAVWIHYFGPGGFYYSTDSSGEWVTQEVGEGGGNVSLAIDPFDTVHVAFVGTGGVRYAIYQPVDGVDQSCDGVDGIDADRDGRASRATGGDDADDTDPGR